MNFKLKRKNMRPVCPSASCGAWHRVPVVIFAAALLLFAVPRPGGVEIRAMSNLVPVEIIAEKIFLIREQTVMLDRDLAELYRVPTGRLNEQVRRNLKRFPEEFMFQMSMEEFKNLKSQFAISSWGGTRKVPFVFTEHGIAMLSSVLNSDRAISVNIQIIKTFIKMRRMMLSYKDLKEKIEKMESKYDKQFRIVFTALKQLLEPPPVPPQGKIGF